MAACGVSGAILSLQLLMYSSLLTTVTTVSTATDQAFFQITTPASHKLYKYIWLTTENQQLRFRIMGKQGAHIALARTPRDITQAYEVIIARHDPPRQQIDILDEINGSPPVASVVVPNTINVNTFSDFWIAWSDGVIRVGQGRVIGHTEEVRWMPQRGLRPITAVSMDTYTNSNITWQFLKDSARDLWLWSRGNDSHSDIWFSEPVRQYFTFGARGCAEAKVGLSAGPGLGSAGQYQTYVVILGVDTNTSVIMDQMGSGGAAAVSASTPAILSCTQMRYFWVSWETGIIQVGKGLTVGDNMFLSWLPDNPHNITSVTPFFGPGAGTDPEFHFRNVEENYYMLKSRSLYNINTTHTINVKQQTSFVFRVRACYNAVLTLRRTSGPHNIRITLGTKTSQGSKSNVTFEWDNGTGDHDQDVDSPDVLSCHESRHLWLAWHDTYMRVGRGDEPYVNQIFQVQNPYLPFSVESLHLGSLTVEYAVEWQFSRSQAPSIAMCVLPSLVASQAWLTAAERTHLLFKVKGQDRVKLLLTSYVGNSEVTIYTILISNLADPHTSAIWREAAKAAGVSKVTTGILSQVILVPFWVSWMGGNIQFGRGSAAGRDVVLTYRDGSESGLLEINTVSFAGASNAMSTWEVGAEQVPTTIMPNTTTTTTARTTTTSQPSKGPRTTTTTASDTGKGSSAAPPPTNTNTHPGSEGGPHIGVVAGVVVGVLLLLVLIALVVFLAVLRYKPESMPREVLGAVPTSVQHKVSRDPNSVPVTFTNRL